MNTYLYNRKSLHFYKTYSCKNCTKCSNCYNCKNGLNKSDLSNNKQSISPNKSKENYPYLLEHLNGLYQGDLTGMTKDKKGIFFSDDNMFYMGEWLNDQINGFGYLFFPIGGYLCARFEKNKIHGVGMINYPNGSRLIGYWKKSKMHGPFFHYYPDKKLWIECEYVEGTLMKYGREETVDINLNHQIPEILSDYPEIRNLVNAIQNNEYLKEFEKPKIKNCEDFAFVKLNYDLIYLGFAKNNVPNGLGIVLHNYCVMFYGYFKKGVLDGIGRINLENGDIYDGYFKDGSFNGLGYYYNNKNDNYFFGNFIKNNCSNKLKWGSKYPISNISIQ